MCATHDCLADLTCILGCFGGSLGGGGGGGGGFGLGDAGIPLTCLGDCVAEGCASAQAFSQDVVNCFLMAALNGTCMGFNLNCLMTACSGPITACIGDKCPPSGG